MRRSVVGVARTRVISQSQNVRSSGVLPTSSDQSTDVLLQVSTLYQGLDLVMELEAFCRVMPRLCGTCSILTRFSASQSLSSALGSEVGFFLQPA